MKLDVIPSKAVAMHRTANFRIFVMLSLRSSQLNWFKFRWLINISVISLKFVYKLGTVSVESKGWEKHFQFYLLKMNNNMMIVKDFSQLDYFPDQIKDN